MKTVKKRGRPKPKVRRPSVQGVKHKSVMLRVDVSFAEWCKSADAKSVTGFTRKLVSVRPMVEMLLANQPVPVVEKA